MGDDGLIGEIRLFAGNFAPRGWAFCQGQTMSIAQNTALFSILGTTYGGDGQTTFKLPDLQGRGAVSAGQGPGLSNYTLGQQRGTETNTMTTANMPAHNHTVLCNSADGSGTSNNPSGEFAAAGPINRSTNQPVNTRFAPASNGQMMGNSSMSTAGGGQPYNNMQPVLVLNYIICLEGIFPSRN